MTSSKDNKTNNVSQFYKIGDSNYIYINIPKADANDKTQKWLQIAEKSPILSNNKILYSPAEAIKSAQNSYISENQYQKYQDSYAKYCNEYRKISFENLKKVITEASFTEDQAKLFCLSLTSEYQKNHTPDFTRLQKSSIHRVSDPNADIFYKFSDKGLEIDGGMYGINIDNLVPRVSIKDGKYTCGATTSSNVSSAMKIEKEKIRQVVLQNFVYEDLLLRQKYGEQLGKAELDFMTKHSENLQKHGLYADKHGKLKQQNPNPSNVIMFNKFTR